MNSSTASELTRFRPRCTGCLALFLIAALVFSPLAAADACDDAKTAVKDLSSFNACINACLKGKKSNAADTVQCLPNKCSLTLTMSPQSKQRACTLGGCQLPRVIVDCPPAKDSGGKRFRPSYLLCPIDSKGIFGQFGINTIEVGEDTAADGSAMTMADIEINPSIDYVEQPLTGEKGVVATSDFGRGCNACHRQGPPGSIDNVKTNTSLPIDTFAKFGQVLRQPDELAPYVIDEQNPNLKAKTDAKVKELGSPVFKGSDPDRTALQKQTLDKICDCIRTDNDNAKKIEAIASDKDQATANLPKDQSGRVTANVRTDGVENAGFSESVLLTLCTQLRDYQAKRSCGKDPPEPGTGMACLGVLGGGKFLTDTAAASAFTLDVSGNATTTSDPTPSAFSFTNVAGSMQAFNYATHTLIQSLTLESLEGTIANNGDLSVTAMGIALVNGSIVNIQLDVADNGGVVAYRILNLDDPNNQVLVGGTGEIGLAAFDLTVSGP